MCQSQHGQLRQCISLFIKGLDSFALLNELKCKLKSDDIFVNMAKDIL